MMGQCMRAMLASCCAGMLAGAAAGAELVVNGSFEQNGGANTNVLTGWTVTDQAGGSGSFFAQTGTTNPTGFSCTATVPAPPGGTFSAMTAQSDPGSHILSQVITIPPASAAQFSARVYQNSGAPFATPASLDYNVSPNQQARIDIMTTASPLTDMGAGILRNVYQTKIGDPVVSGYNLIAADLSAFAGQTVRLRIVEADNQGCFSFGVDTVSIQQQSNAIPTLSEGAALALAALLLGVAALRLRRR
jgi:hypothetical protein